MLSFWERESFTRYDHIIIGSGITGVSAAIALKERFTQERVLILERGLLPTGATTRNAGFACMGSAGEILADLEHSTEDAARELFLQRKAGLELLRKRFKDEELGYESHGGYELLAPCNLSVIDQLDRLNTLLRPHLGQNAFEPANARIRDFGFSETLVAGLIHNTCEGSIHSGKTMRSLLSKASAVGVEIKTGAAVQRFEEHEACVHIDIADPVRRDSLRLETQTLSICTNAFSKHLLPDVDVTPGRGQVLVTEPIPGLPFKGVFHYDEGYYYFRELDGRVLIGGGRNLDFEGETTTEIALAERIQQDLEMKLHEMILPGRDFRIDTRWAGIMAFGPTKAPIVQAFSDRVFGAFRMGGMGVALGSGAADAMVKLIASR
jgi:glycine/D-amino acid oxidase-like deaminating enzyme